MRAYFWIAASVLASASAVEPQVPLEIQIAAFAYAAVKDPFNLIDCLQVDGADPPSEVLSKLVTRIPNVVPGSECERNMKRGSFHRTTDRDAFSIMLAHYQRIDDAHAKISLVTYGRPMSHEGSTLLLEATEHGWVVSGSEQQMWRE